MADTNTEPPNGCEQVPASYSVTISPVEDNGTPGYLQHIGGKWWLVCYQRGVVREVSDEEFATMQMKW